MSTRVGGRQAIGERRRWGLLTFAGVWFVRAGQAIGYAGREVGRQSAGQGGPAFAGREVGRPLARQGGRQVIKERRRWGLLIFAGGGRQVGRGGPAFYLLSMQGGPVEVGGRLAGQAGPAFGSLGQGREGRWVGRGRAGNRLSRQGR
ncbi:hypothetical protein PPACK8108_LOCUS3127 [Phakopsora pachyrhizi]|uniref:Uncharacterized protein n=1 Tax=Phakopsora pachyrhizi TaxID=170000 RepID=A0AAV0AJX5_PHAPC|nr:hypothetical protein PPACK8108_LOCUS3127 [Phakopsora pachyrhizi]